VFFSQVLKLSSKDTMLIGLCFPVVFVLCFFVAMTPPTVTPGGSLEPAGGAGAEELEAFVDGSGADSHGTAGSQDDSTRERRPGQLGEEDTLEMVPASHSGGAGPETAQGAMMLSSDGRTSDSSSLLGHPMPGFGADGRPVGKAPVLSAADRPDTAAHTMTWRQRCATMASLVPVMLSLAIVYFAEYTINTGVAGTLSFPAESTSKHQFYQRAQLTYQLGVFLSRSSGTIFPINTLWPMPVGQVFSLGFFVVQSTTQLLASGWLMLLFVVVEGLLGGLVYVNAFRRLREESPPALREFNLGVASMADTIGIAIAAGVSIWMEHALDAHRAASGLPVS
jgi:hypothetical protein